MAFEGQAKPSKIKSVMKWWSKRICMVIAKTASRSVAFKISKRLRRVRLLSMRKQASLRLRREDTSSGHESLDDDDVEEATQI